MKIRIQVIRLLMKYDGYREFDFVDLNTPCLRLRPRMFEDREMRSRKKLDHLLCGLPRPSFLSCAILS